MARKTFAPNPNKISKTRHVIDAEGKVLGKLAVEVASILTGKKKPTYSPNELVGDYVTITNADKVVLTGNKLHAKTYVWYTGFPGGYREEKADKLLSRKPEEVVRKAVNGMLPKNKLRKRMLANLTITADGGTK